MNSYIVTILLLTSVYTVYRISSSIYYGRYHARRAKELGCKPPARRPHYWPLGFDMLWRVIKADRARLVPDAFVQIHEAMGNPTFVQRFLGNDNFSTVEPKNIQAILATQFKDFEIGPTRRGNFFPLLGNGIFTSDGRAWEHSRGLLRPQFARDQVADLEMMETHLQVLFQHLKPGLDGWTSDVDLSPMFFRFTLDAATQFLFGQSVESQHASLPGATSNQGPVPPKGELDWTSFGPCFDKAMMTIGHRSRLQDAYSLWSPKSFFDDCRKVHEFADHYVNLALNEDVEKSASRDRYVFLKELIKTTRDPVEIRSQLLNMLVAGRDTTAGLLGWTFYLLVRNPQVYNQLRKSILDAFGTYENSQAITFANLKTCSYLQYTMNEVLRLFPSVPLNSRRAVRDTTIPLGGGPDGTSPVYVRKGQEVNYHVHVMHRRKDIWGADFDKFVPERWHGRKVGWEYLPFNGGPRICLGQQFALTEAGYVIARMVQRFDKLENWDDDPVTRHAYSVTTSPVAVKVRLHVASES